MSKKLVFKSSMDAKVNELKFELASIKSALECEEYKVRESSYDIKKVIHQIGVYKEMVVKSNTLDNSASSKNLTIEELVLNGVLYTLSKHDYLPF